MQLFTIGHSTHSIEFFLELLEMYEIKLVIDVRAFPQSRRMPWFGKLNLTESLTKHQIAYKHMPALGGMRKPREDSVNLSFRNLAFRGFADYMQTPLFAAALQSLNDCLSIENNTVMMCAEGNPLNCHRSLISDTELVRGIIIKHILPNKELQLHELTKHARVDYAVTPTRIFYPKSKA